MTRSREMQWAVLIIAIAGGIFHLSDERMTLVLLAITAVQVGIGLDGIEKMGQMLMRRKTEEEEV